MSSYVTFIWKTIALNASYRFVIVVKRKWRHALKVSTDAGVPAALKRDSTLIIQCRKHGVERERETTLHTWNLTFVRSLPFNRSSKPSISCHLVAPLMRKGITGEKKTMMVGYQGYKIYLQNKRQASAISLKVCIYVYIQSKLALTHFYKGKTLVMPYWDSNIFLSEMHECKILISLCVLMSFLYLYHTYMKR